MSPESNHSIENNGSGARWDIARAVVVPQIDRFTSCGSSTEDRIGGTEMLSKVSILMDADSERLLSYWSRVFDDSDPQVRATAFEQLDKAYMPKQIRHWIRSDAEEREALRTAPPTFRDRARRLGLASIDFFFKDPQA